MKKCLLPFMMILAILSTSWVSSAQTPEVERSAEKTNFSIGTNLVQWANFGTINLEAGFSVHRKITLNVGARINPWKFNDKKLDVPVWNNQQTFYAGMRFWPWYVFSGFWAGVKAQYSKASSTGIWRSALQESSAVGVGLSLGYTLMITTHFNIEFGVGAWGGRYLNYTVYDCPDCLEIRDEGPRFFGNLDDVSISLSYVF